MKRMITSAALFLCVSVPVCQAVNWYEGTFDAAKTLAALENKLILVDFYGAG